MSKLIVGLGEALVDILPGGQAIGGAPLNFSVRGAELGSRLAVCTSMVTRIGDDLHGKQVWQRLVEAGVDCSAVQIDQRYPTGTVDIRLVAGWAPARIVSAANLCGAFVASQSGATKPLSRQVIDKILGDLDE